MSEPYVYLTIEINELSTDENLMRRHITLETWNDLDVRVEQEIAWYGQQQHRCIRWRAVSGDGAHYRQERRGEWGYEGDDWAEPPTVGGEVI